MYKICGYILIIIVFCFAIFSFLPRNLENDKYYFRGYKANLDNYKSKILGDESINDDVNTENILDEEKNKEENIEIKKDTLDFNREIEDVLKEFLISIKKFDFETAEKYLSSPKYSSDEENVIYILKYNEEFGFFKTYLTNYVTSVRDITQTEEGASASLVIRRFDINKLQKKFVEEKAEVNMNNLNPTNSEIEENLYQNQEFLNSEFMKSSVPIIEDIYTIKFVKENDEWKIVNDAYLVSSIVNLDFIIKKPNRSN